MEPNVVAKPVQDMTKKILQESLLMDDYLYGLCILTIMLLAGLLGGFASYHLNESDDKSTVKSITLGIVAAMIVPVFLNMISSSLLVEAQKSVDKLFVFLGFCVLASVFSRNFLEKHTID